MGLSALPTGIYQLLGASVAIGVLIAVLRWTYGTRGSQLSPPVRDPDDPTGDGLLEEVSRVPTEAAAQVLRRRLGESGIRATVGRDGEVFRLLVFRGDLVAARVVLSRGALE